MNPLEKKKMLKEKFKKQKEKRIKQNKEIISFKELGIQIEPETFDWYKEIIGGVKYE